MRLPPRRRSNRAVISSSTTLPTSTHISAPTVCTAPWSSSPLPGTGPLPGSPMRATRFTMSRCSDRRIVVPVKRAARIGWSRAGLAADLLCCGRAARCSVSPRGNRARQSRDRAHGRSVAGRCALMQQGGGPMRLKGALLAAVLWGGLGLTILPDVAPAQGLFANLPRNETLILENPEGTIKNAGWFNIWAINAGSQSNGLQQAALDTLWYIDPNRGLDGVWQNSLAADKPQYNADFTEMTVKLRPGIYWSDGVEFSAADVVHTVTTQIKHKNMRWSAALALNV